MLPQETIRRKRNGEKLSPEEIAIFVHGITTGEVSEMQAAAFAMSVFFQGMSAPEIVALTLAMRDSGPVLAWPSSEFPGPIVDKHSTGGIGDTVSLVLAPMLAAVGAFVPMISGRGLGHTGGTLDKLDSIPGYVSQPDIVRFKKTVRDVGCAIIGQTPDLVPADRRLYAIRDVTATVESIPLIVASILSKKLAAGLGALVLDVKVGSGAFMTSDVEAHRLAELLITVAQGASLPAAALITDMDEPLAPLAGNALEVMHAIKFLKGERDQRMEAVTVALGAELLVLCGLSESSATAADLLRGALDKGHAAERFQKMVAALGGPGELLERPERFLPRAPIVEAVYPPATGRVASIDTRALGVAVILLGGGRKSAGDSIDHAVGLASLARKGAEVGPKVPLAFVHARDEKGAAEASAIVKQAYAIGSELVLGPVVRNRIVGHA